MLLQSNEVHRFVFLINQIFISRENFVAMRKCLLIEYILIIILLAFLEVINNRYVLSRLIRQLLITSKLIYLKSGPPSMIFESLSSFRHRCLPNYLFMYIFYSLFAFSYLIYFIKSSYYRFYSSYYVF